MEITTNRNKDTEVSNISWTQDHNETTNSPAELPSMPPESTFQPEHNNTKQSVVLQDAQIPQEAKDKLSSLLEGDYNSTVSKSHRDVGRKNLFQMDIPTMGPPTTCKPYPIPLKDKESVGEEVRLLEKAGCISKSLSMWATPEITVPKKPNPLNPQKQTALLSVRLPVTK